MTCMHFWVETWEHASCCWIKHTSLSLSVSSMPLLSPLLEFPYSLASTKPQTWLVSFYSISQLIDPLIYLINLKWNHFFFNDEKQWFHSFSFSRVDVLTKYLHPIYKSLAPAIETSLHGLLQFEDNACGCEEFPSEQSMQACLVLVTLIGEWIKRKTDKFCGWQRGPLYVCKGVSFWVLFSMRWWFLRPLSLICHPLFIFYLQNQ